MMQKQTQMHICGSIMTCHKFLMMMRNWQRLRQGADHEDVVDQDVHTHAENVLLSWTGQSLTKTDLGSAVCC